MSKRHDLKAELLSKIDPQLLDKTTERRAKLLVSMQERKTLMVKRLTPILAAAACLCLIMTAVFSFMFGGSGDPSGPGGTPGVKQVPIYTGMTVSTSAPVASASVDRTQNSLFAKIGNFFGIQTLDSSNNVPNLDGNSGNHNGQIKHTDANGNVIEAEGATPIFYATAGQDFYITVHIDNPDRFEIMSFTLNGEKYSSYMFENGSDMENLILKCNEGDSAGLVEYTIDAIKYVDGTEIKDVEIGGNKTIKVGLYSEAIQPKTTVSGEKVSYDSISFKAKVTDDYSMITRSEGTATAHLYLNDDIVASKDIALTEDTSVVFDALEPSTEYWLVIVAKYDSFDGKGQFEYVIREKSFRTKTLFSVNISNISFHTADISYTINKDADVNLITAELFKGSEKVKDLSLEDQTITELLSDNEYTVKMTLTKNGKVYTAEQKFTTNAYPQPDISVAEFSSTFHSISINIELSDKSGLGSYISRIVCSDNINHEQETDKASHTFENLNANTYYYLIFYYKCDKKDGKGEQEFLLMSDDGVLPAIGRIKTKGYSKPSVSISNIVTDYTSIAFDLELSNEYDLDGEITVEVIDRTDGDIPRGLAKGVGRLTFNDLYSGLSHKIRVKFKGDFRDGQGEKEIVILEEEIATKAYTKPTFSIIDITSTKNSISFEISENDPDNRGKIEEIELYRGDNLIAVSTDPTLRTFYGLELAKFYTLKVRYSYYLNNPFLDGDIIDSINISTQSEGLAIANGEVVGIGTCSDSDLYINMPIAASAFENNTTISSVTLGKNVLYVEDKAFAGCPYLHTVTVHHGLQSLGDSVFYNCTSLGSIALPSSTHTIGASTFENCASLRSAYLPSYLIHINSNLFYGCINLSSVIMPETLVSIGSWAFKDCASLGTITIPSRVETITDMAFEGCIRLKTVHISRNYFDIVFELNYEDGFSHLDEDPIHSPFMYGADMYMNGKKVTELVIPHGVSELSGHFAGSTIVKLSLPASLVNFQRCLLSECKYLTDITYAGSKEQWYKVENSMLEIPNGVTVHCTDGDILY